MNLLSKVVFILLFFTFSAILASCGDTESLASSDPDPIVVTDCESKTGMDKLICLADAFKAQLDASQLALVQRNYSVSEAKKWSNFPQALLSSANERVGLSFADMTSAQISYAKALVKAAAGTGTDEGWDEVQQIINADNYLYENGGGSDYGYENYFIALLGTPAASGTWELQFGGHHLAFANTYTDGLLVGATPSFRSSEPFDSFEYDSKSNQPVVQEKNALSAMLSALSATQLTSAKLGSTFSDLIAGPGSDDAFPSTASGIRVGDLDAAQQALVLAAIETYVDDIDDDNAATLLAKYAAELADTYISYSGNTGLISKNDYARIDGPSVWIEYSCQNGIVLDPTHPHSVWRDKTSDYGGN